MLIYLNLIDTEEERSKFEEIYSHYKYVMFYVSRNILDDDFLAEDAVHEAFIKIAENIDCIAGSTASRIRNYTVIIARNISLNMLKKEKRTISVDELEEITCDDRTLEDEVLSKLSFDLILEEIAGLPVIYRDVLYLTYVEELSIKEISCLINTSDEAVKKRLQRGRKKLAENLKKGVK